MKKLLATFALVGLTAATGIYHGLGDNQPAENAAIADTPTQQAQPTQDEPQAAEPVATAETPVSETTAPTSEPVATEPATPEPAIVEEPQPEPEPEPEPVPVTLVSVTVSHEPVAGDPTKEDVYCTYTYSDGKVNRRLLGTRQGQNIHLVCPGRES